MKWEIRADTFDPRRRSTGVKISWSGQFEDVEVEEAEAGAAWERKAPSTGHGVVDGYEDGGQG